MTTVIWSVAIGLLGGVMSGLFGIGGGIVIVPALVYFLSFEQHKAQGTSLLALVFPVGLLAVINYYKQEAVDIKAGLLVAAGLLVGALAGSKIALGLDQTTMRKSFAVFLVVVGIYQFFKK